MIKQSYSELKVKNHQVPGFIRRYLPLQQGGRVILIVLFFLCLSIPALAQGPASGPTVVSRSWLPIQTIEGTFKEVMLVLEFAPGAGSPPHTHGGPTLITILEGELTLIQDGTETTYTAGESWTEMPGKVHEVFNAGSTPTRTVFTVLLSGDAEVTTFESDEESSIPLPTVLSRSEFPDISMNGLFAEVMLVLEFAPGAGVPQHTHSGPTLITILEGELTLIQDGTETTYTAGESWTEIPGKVHEVFNTGSTPTRTVFTVLLPVAPPTTLVEQ